ncbi:MAG: type II secretion system GspH family protein [Synergistaceae bacterium]|jgi:prepilin-type N-terminal cleavage/methylation domain-containing protein|nr:type II secretion system GspH family protein [Synergistaceae bacterium]
MRNDDKRRYEALTGKNKHSAGGFSLVELMLTMVIIGILASLVVLGTGAGQENAEALRIMAGMESVKSALLTYAQYNESRSYDPLYKLIQDSGGIFSAMLPKIIPYLDRSQLAPPLDELRFMSIGAADSSRMYELVLYYQYNVSDSMRDKLMELAGKSSTFIPEDRALSLPVR